MVDYDDDIAPVERIKRERRGGRPKATRAQRESLPSRIGRQRPEKARDVTPTWAGKRPGECPELPRRPPGR